MAWECTNCGAVDLNGAVCMFCGARRDAASRTAKLKAKSDTPVYSGGENVPALNMIFATIGMVSVFITTILSIFTGQPARSPVLNTNAEDGNVNIYAAIGVGTVVVLVLFLFLVGGRG